MPIRQHSPRPAPFIPRVLSSGKKCLSTTIKASRSSLRTHKVVPSRQGSGYRRGLGGAAQWEGAQSGTEVQWVPHSRSARARTYGAHPTPSPHPVPQGSGPIRGRARNTARGQTPQLLACARDPDLPLVSLLGHTHCPGAASPPGLRSASHSGSVPAPQDSAPGLWQKRPASREGVCARARPVCTREGPALPCAPAPAPRSPRYDASRIPNARSLPPRRSHSCARTLPPHPKAWNPGPPDLRRAALGPLRANLRPLPG